MDFSKKLQKLRKEKNLSQEGLGEILGVSRQAVSKWESGAAYPETEKILALCQFYGVAADDLLLDTGREPPAPAIKKRRVWPWMAAAVCLCGTLAMLLAFSCAKQREYLSDMTRQSAELAARQAEAEALQLELNTQSALVSELEQKLEQAAADTQKLSGRETVPEWLRQYFFVFTRTWRFDYVPFFAPEQAPRESSEYLMWAYAVNLDGWDKTGDTVMSRDYVENTVLSHFAVAGLSHTPLRKTWNFDGETYTAVPGGIKELPLYVLRSFSLDAAGLYTVELDCCGIWREGSFWIASPEEEKKLETGLGEAYGNWLRSKQVERFTFRLGPDGPVFLSHTLADSK